MAEHPRQLQPWTIPPLEIDDDDPAEWISYIDLEDVGVSEPLLVPADITMHGPTAATLARAAERNNFSRHLFHQPASTLDPEFRWLEAAPPPRVVGLHVIIDTPDGPRLLCPSPGHADDCELWMPATRLATPCQPELPLPPRPPPSASTFISIALAKPFQPNCQPTSPGLPATTPPSSHPCPTLTGTNCSPFSSPPPRTITCATTIAQRHWLNSSRIASCKAKNTPPANT